MSRKCSNTEKSSLPAKKSVVDFVDALLAGEAGAKDALIAAVDTERYMRVFQERARVKATPYAAKAIEAVGEKAASGDVDAARLIFNITGLFAAKGGINILNQINMTPQERQAIEADLKEDAIDV